MCCKCMHSALCLLSYHWLTWCLSNQVNKSAAWLTVFNSQHVYMVMQALSAWSRKCRIHGAAVLCFMYIATKLWYRQLFKCTIRGRYTDGVSIHTHGGGVVAWLVLQFIVYNVQSSSYSVNCLSVFMCTYMYTNDCFHATVCIILYRFCVGTSLRLGRVVRLRRPLARFDGFRRK